MSTGQLASLKTVEALTRHGPVVGGVGAGSVDDVQHVDGVVRMQVPPLQLVPGPRPYPLAQLLLFQLALLLLLLLLALHLSLAFALEKANAHGFKPEPGPDN